MARGWESKSVESQQEDSQTRRVRQAPRSAEERARLDRRRTIELALARTEAELRAACHAAHRDMLRLRLDALNAELRKLA